MKSKPFGEIIIVNPNPKEGEKPVHSKAKKNIKKDVGLGDMVHGIAHPIAKAIDSIIGTKIHECGGCQKRRETLNRKFPIKNSKKHIKE